MSLLTQGNAQVTAAAKAGMSERTARKYAHSGRAPSVAKVAHTWRTRPDPFEAVDTLATLGEWLTFAEKLYPRFDLALGQVATNAHDQMLAMATNTAGDVVGLILTPVA